VKRLAAWWKRGRRKLLRLLAIGIGTSVVATALSATGYLESNQARALDLLLQLRGRALPSDVVIVAIDSAAFQALGRRQPLARDYVAKIVRGAQKAGAAVVALDLALDTPTRQDGALADAIAAFSDGGVSRVIISADGPPDGPLATLASRVKVLRAFVEVPEDGDGVVRRTALLVAGEKVPFRPSLALATAARMTNADPEVLARHFDAGPPRLLHVNFVGPARTFLTIPSDVVVALADGEAPPDNPLRGRAVLVGGTFPESRDFLLTAHGQLPGVEVHANVVHMLLTGNVIRPAGWVLGLGIQILASSVAAVVMVSTGAVVSAVLCLVLPFLIALPASYLAFNSGGYWVDFVLPVFATRLLGSIAMRVEGHRIQQAFGRYVSREVAAEVFADAPGLRGEHREVSILFSDLRNFTTLSETREPAEIATQLNEYFSAMTAAIFRQRGMVNDFIGDAVMGIFGAPLADPDHARHAVAAAEGMAKGLEALNERRAEAGLPALQMGIGVHTGTVFAGNVGGRARFKYTIVGDAVNVASRVEGVNKELGTTILITAATHARLSDTVRARARGLVPVKGRNEPVRVYEWLTDGHDSARPPLEGKA
jgi:adenylate cyclase